MSDRLALGVDIGTSGVRVAAVREDGTLAHLAKAEMDLTKGGRNDPEVWLDALAKATSELASAINPSTIEAISVDGTSGTVLALDQENRPVGSALMYNDATSDPKIPKAIAAVAPKESAAHGPASALSRTLELQKRSGVTRIAHQADWIAEQLAGTPVPSDESNALKTGYDPIARCWPDWLSETGITANLLPDVVQTGTATAITNGSFGLPSGIPIVAGVSDGCASFLATGAKEVGDAVTALGTTMTLKLLSDTPIFAPEYGIYSHRIGERWLAGGASNTGGGVLLQYFSEDEMANLSDRIDPEQPSGLDYYPLSKTGERFPINDPDLAPKLSPRPEDDVQFFHGLLEGIARIEALGYQRLKELGAPSLKTLRTVGGGGKNKIWKSIRNTLINAPTPPSQSGEAAVGSAHIARSYLEGSR
ncbi:xylulose kinase [Roseibium sp. TrichSKD4]|uniref:FGGY-family carbohydrate kinase n=1 Tax=Roseibium sp. TrichSKD4 TaxID=744980 RepID=UPI0001E56E84|nr:FGGY-family carbohydrate kinase [Roseibium sp. TrichSKD4]EFO32027.1 xylulose kinase [Roseibium sp. TrichSKD4]